MKIYSLSHTDLDGYGSQFVLDTFYDNIKYYNADYGDVGDVLDDIMKVIEKDDILYITDLNLTLDLAEKLNSHKIDKGFNLQLLDHHITGYDAFEKYEWYYLDTNICATKITYQYLKDLNPRIVSNIEEIVDMINVYDMWLKKDKLFRKSQLLSNLIYENKIDSNKNSQFMISLIKKTGLLLQDWSVQEVERYIPAIICDELGNLTKNKHMKQFIESKDIATTVKLGTFPAETLNDRICLTKNIDGVDVIFFKDISSRTSQYAFDYLLDSYSYKENVLVKYNSKNQTLSCRSRNGKAVAIAKLFGGGGHADAAGAKLEEGKTLEDYLD